MKNGAVCSGAGYGGLVDLFLAKLRLVNPAVLCLLAFLGAAGGRVCAQQPEQPAAQQPETQPGTSQQGTAQQTTQSADEPDAAPVALPVNPTPEERESAAWKRLTDAAADAKHAQTRIQALAALSLLRSPRSEKMIIDAMKDPDVDVRTAAVLAAGQTRDRNLTTSLRNLLDDKEPQVDFTAAITLWKMNDRSGEDILMAVVDGDRSAGPTMMHGTEHKINKDLHDPGMLARLGALQGAEMLLGPFGYGITAFEFMHQSGGNVARASAIEQLSQERTEPVHKELVAALGDKDQTVRAAAAKALGDYHDQPTQLAVYALLADPKNPVRLTAAAAYLRTTGVPGPPPLPGTPGAAGHCASAQRAGKVKPAAGCGAG